MMRFKLTGNQIVDTDTGDRFITLEECAEAMNSMNLLLKLESEDNSCYSDDDDVDYAAPLF